MSTAEKFFTDNINRLPKLGTPGLTPEQAIQANLNWGLLYLARHLDSIEQQISKLQHDLRDVQSRVQRL